MRVLVAVALLVAATAAGAAETISIGGAGPLLGTLELLAESYTNAYPDRKVQVVPRDPNKNQPTSMGTKGGVSWAIKGRWSDGTPFIGFASEVKDDQRKLGARAIEVARVALVFVVPANAAPPVENLTRQQVIDIYSRKWAYWRPDLPIQLVRRQEDESDNSILIGHMPELAPLIKRLLDDRNKEFEALPRLPPVATDAQASAWWIENHVGTFGTSSTNQIVTEKRRLKALRFNGVEPTPANVANETYPLQKHVYLVTGANVTADMQHFIDFVRTSPRSKDIFTRSGHAFMGGR